MKKSVLLSVIGVLLVVGVGITFAYFTSGVEVSGNGSTVELNPGDMIKVSYDAGDNSLSSNNLIPGETLTKTFRVTITPTSKENTASYSIYLDLTNNTFVKCDDTNYNSITNACIKDYEELTYEFKDSNGEVVSSGNLIGLTGRTLLIAETKTVDKETTYEYTMEITFHETNADQNHNMEKVINGSIEVEFGMVGSEYILSHYDTILTRNNFSTTVTETTTGTIYKSLDESQYDDFGEVYYFAGNPTDNWVHFGGFYWRIIRINGNGSIRMIYSGSDATGPVTTGTDTQIGTSAFNSLYKDSSYVGYRYTIGSTHGVDNPSTIQEVIDTWYKTNIENQEFEDYLNNGTGFCGDRAITYTSGGLIYYGAHTRLTTDKNPSFKCKEIGSDLYTTIMSDDGNKSLMYPVALITADEVAYAGAIVGNFNIYNYLYNGLDYWTITPDFYNSGSVVFRVRSIGGLSDTGATYNDFGIRPVINLKSDVQITGSGTISDPFKIN